MSGVLFLCHRLPWPPTKGDKIRSYHVLQRLEEHHCVYLGAFVDDPNDWPHVPAVKALCADTCIRPLKSRQAKFRSLAAFLRGEPLTVGYYRDRMMGRWVERVLAGHKVDLALCYSSGVAPFVMRHKQLRRVMDFVDVDSDKWRQYAATHCGVSGMIYRREARRLAQYERAIAAQFDAGLFVSESEADFFRRSAPESADRVHGIPNGVDSDYWNPDRNYPNPYRPGERVVVFVGAMDYWANVHAMQWFVREVWPRVQAGRPQSHLYIVGAKPTPAVLALAQRPGVAVTGRVEDVRPYLAHAHAAVTPLRIARGIQNKVLEALAMGKVLLATPQAYEGIEDFEGRLGCISELPEAMAAEAVRWLGEEQPAQVVAARELVQARYRWEKILDAYESVLQNTPDFGMKAQTVAERIGLEAFP